MARSVCLMYRGIVAFVVAQDLLLTEPSDFMRVPGKGVGGHICGVHVRVSNEALM